MEVCFWLWSGTEQSVGTYNNTMFLGLSQVVERKTVGSFLKVK